jgi:hypothetical protein
VIHVTSAEGPMFQNGISLGALAMDRDQYVSHVREEANYEIARLKEILRQPGITQEEREIALAMLKFYEDVKVGELLERVVKLRIAA